jgi:hypothetical protein
MIKISNAKDPLVRPRGREDVELFLPPTFYRFIFEDTAGDWVCCGRDGNGYVLFIFENFPVCLYKLDGNVDTPFTSCPQAFELPDPYLTHIAVKGDNDSTGKTRWELVGTTNDGVTITDSYDLQDGVIFEKDVVTPPGTYTFTITDADGDGVCCDKGHGYVQIALSNSVEILCDGEFGAELTFSFTIE